MNLQWKTRKGSQIDEPGLDVHLVWVDAKLPSIDGKSVDKLDARLNQIIISSCWTWSRHLPCLDYDRPMERLEQSSITHSSLLETSSPPMQLMEVHVRWRCHRVQDKFLTSQPRFDGVLGIAYLNPWLCRPSKVPAGLHLEVQKLCLRTTHSQSHHRSRSSNKREDQTMINFQCTFLSILDGRLPTNKIRVIWSKQHTWICRLFITRLRSPIRGRPSSWSTAFDCCSALSHSAWLDVSSEFITVKLSLWPRGLINLGTLSSWLILNELGLPVVGASDSETEDWRGINRRDWRRNMQGNVFHTPILYFAFFLS